MDILMYLIVFLAKTVEVTLSTVRVVLASRGEKLKSAAIGFFEVLIWLLVVSYVLGSITQDPLKAFFYCLAFSCGIYLGIIVEGKLAIGTANIQVMVAEQAQQPLCEKLRGMGFGVTVVQGRGMETPVNILMIYLKRKHVPEAIGIIGEYSPSSMVTVNDVRHLRSGYIRK